MANFVVVFRAKFARNRSVLGWSDQCFKSFSNRGRHLLFEQQYIPDSPNSWAKFQICCTDMYLIRFLPNFVVFCVFLWLSWDFADLPKLHGSATARNIRSPVYNKTKCFLYLPRLQRSLFRQNQSNISLEAECNHYFPFFSVRFSLGVISLFAFSKFRSSISLTFGSDVGVFLALITASQFHLLFYLSRPLPNTFALVLGK